LSNIYGTQYHSHVEDPPEIVVTDCETLTGPLVQIEDEIFHNWGLNAYLKRRTYIPGKSYNSDWLNLVCYFTRNLELFEWIS